MSAVVDLRHRKVESIDDIVSEVHRQFGLMRDAETKSHNTRVRAATLLVELRKRIENGEEGEGVDWWQWYAEKFARTGRGRKDAEKLMRWVASGNPEAKHEEAKKVMRERMQRVRADGAYVGSNNFDSNQDDSRGGAPWDDDQPSGESAPTPDGLVEQAWRLIMRMTAEQRRVLLAKLQELRQ